MVQFQGSTSNPEIDAEVPSARIAPKSVRHQLAKVLPTDRISFDKQVQVLLAYAAHGGPSRNAVTNENVAETMGDIAPSSVSLCNQFFVDMGLLIAEGRRLRPSVEAQNFQHARAWKDANAGLKLSPVFSASWAAQAILPRVSFRDISKIEAIQLLAAEARAIKNHQKQIETLLEWLNLARVIEVEGDSVRRCADTDATRVAEPPAYYSQPVIPGSRYGGGSPESQSTPVTEEEQGRGGAADHNFIRGLLDRLPEVGSRWSYSERAKWLRTAISVFDLMYDGDSSRQIEVKVQKAKVDDEDGDDPS